MISYLICGSSKEANNLINAFSIMPLWLQADFIYLLERFIVFLKGYWVCTVSCQLYCVWTDNLDMALKLQQIVNDSNNNNYKL